MRGANLTVIYTVLLSAVVAFSVMQPSVPVLAEISVRYDVDQPTTAWVATVYLLSSSILAPLLDRLGDGFARRRTPAVMVGFALFSSLAPAHESPTRFRVRDRIVRRRFGSDADPVRPCWLLRRPRVRAVHSAFGNRAVIATARVAWPGLRTGWACAVTRCSRSHWGCA
jgi:hypothetical protein